MSEAAGEVNRTSVDGVTVFWLDVAGPVQAVLTFRVGVIDETLPIHGITHIVEHVAMHSFADTLLMANRANARVEPLRTRFMATGTPEEIVTFLADVTANLGNLPLDRLEDERKILRTEAANRTNGSLKAVWTWRWGTRGLGVVDYEEFGLRWLNADHVMRWSSDWFTAGNAVLWLSGEPPPGLKLNLVAGERKQVPQFPPLDCKTPAIYRQGDRWVLHSMLGKRGMALGLGSIALNHRLRERLRHQRSLAYETNSNYQRINGEIAEITSFADSLAANARDAAVVMTDTLKELAGAGPSGDELHSIVGEMRRARQHPDAPFARLDQLALDELEGVESKSDAERDAEAAAVTPRDVANAFEEAYASSFLSLPNEVPMAVEGYTPIPLSSSKRITGIQVRPMPGSDNADSIEFSTEGISFTSAKARTNISIRWLEVAAALWWTEGRRTLIAVDGSWIGIVPGLWQHVETLLEAVQKNVPADRWVPMDEPGSVPRQPEPVCAICESSPAIEVTFHSVRSALWWRVNSVHGILCRDCGIAKFREVQRGNVVHGWWSVPGVVATPFVMLGNMLIWQRFRSLPVPIHTSGITPLSKGRTIWLYPGMLIPLGIVLLIAWIFRPI